MIVILGANAAEHDLWRAIRDVVTVLVFEEQNVRRAGDDHLVTQDTNTERGVHVIALVEDFGVVCRAVAVGVFEDHDAIALGTQLPPFLEQAVIGALGGPHPSAGVDIHADDIADHRLGRVKTHGETVRDLELFQLFGSGGGTEAGGVGSESWN